MGPFRTHSIDCDSAYAILRVWLLQLRRSSAAVATERHRSPRSGRADAQGRDGGIREDLATGVTAPVLPFPGFRPPVPES
jgi:hypothetical protein